MIAHWDHEPLERGCVEDQPQQSRSGNMLRLVDDDTAALRVHGPNARPELEVEAP